MLTAGLVVERRSVALCECKVGWLISIINGDSLLFAVREGHDNSMIHEFMYVVRTMTVIAVAYYWFRGTENGIE